MFIYILLQIAVASEPKPVVCYNNYDPTDKSRVFIYKTLKKLNKDLNNHFVITTNKNCKDGDYKFRVYFGYLWGNVAGNASGIFNESWAYKDCRINIYSKVDIEYKDNVTKELKEELRLIFLHEFGHCIGLIHSKNLFDIMYTSIEPFFQVEKESYKRYLKGLKVKLK